MIHIVMLFFRLVLIASLLHICYTLISWSEFQLKEIKISTDVEITDDEATYLMKHVKHRVNALLVKNIYFISARKLRTIIETDPAFYVDIVTHDFENKTITLHMTIKRAEYRWKETEMGAVKAYFNSFGRPYGPFHPFRTGDELEVIAPGVVIDEAIYRTFIVENALADPHVTEVDYFGKLRKITFTAMMQESFFTDRGLQIILDSRKISASGFLEMYQQVQKMDVDIPGSFIRIGHPDGFAIFSHKPI